MTTGSILFSLALLLLVGLFIARPFLLPAPRPPRQSERQILLAQQEALLAQIQAIDFDVETGKVMPEDHTAERHHLLHQAAQIMAELEATAATPSAQAIEAAVRDLRQKGHGRFCPQCGTAVGVGDKFCASCGGLF
ncbi:MAG: zinc ribbon domain-containing protein [Chloroflexi bacterium]|nr:zinc ribbon domain-containing protein [Chloroflexota bacterium]